MHNPASHVNKLLILLVIYGYWRVRAVRYPHLLATPHLPAPSVPVVGSVESRRFDAMIGEAQRYPEVTPEVRQPVST
jgi:hypothetical protein